MSNDTPQIVTERMVFRGLVQGVGFRYSARSIAKQLNISGYVRNLSDGTVEIVARGARGAITDLLTRIVDTFPDNEIAFDRNPVEGGESFSVFDIRY